MYLKPIDVGFCRIETQNKIAQGDKERIIIVKSH